MKHVVALVGRPNVGKSTLFNRLTKTRDALVADQPGLTRDRRYGLANLNEQAVILVDTGGITDEDGIDALVTKQAWAAIEESQLVLFLCDGRAGLNPDDEVIAKKLRTLNKKTIVLVNKTEGLNKSVAVAEFFAIGLGDPVGISASHGEGVSALVDYIEEHLPPAEPEEEQEQSGAKVAMIGRPNVGKSTLINRLLGEERVLAFDAPGTTRDSIAIPFERDGRQYTLIDTAGVRRRSRVDDMIEKFSVIKTLQAIDECNVVVVVIDAREGIGGQDLTLLGYAIDAGKGLLIAINKWDGLSEDQKTRVKNDIQRRLGFADYASIHFISALHGTGVGELMRVVDRAYRSAYKAFATSELTRILEDAVNNHQPPLVKGRRIKLRYAHQGGKNPTRIIIHGNQTDSVPDSYRRYLANIFRDVLQVRGSPVFIDFKSGDNPYKDKRNTLTSRQIRKRKRLVKHVKKNKR